jgi:hypothetical protein
MDPRREAVLTNSSTMGGLLLEAGFYSCINDCIFLALATNAFKTNEYFLVTGKIYRVYHRDELCQEPSKLIEYTCFILTNIQDIIRLLESEHISHVIYASKVNDKLVVAIECERLNKLLEESKDRLPSMSKARSSEEVTRYYWCIDSIRELGGMI